MSIKAQNKAAEAVLGAANYISGKGDDVATFKSTRQLAQFVTLAATAQGAAQEQADLLAGGVRGMVLVALLVVSRVEKLGKGDAPGGSISAARDWLRNNGVFPDTKDAKQTNVWSECSKIAATLAAWKPALPDAATATQEAMALVRDGLAKHGSFKAWRKAAPNTSTKGRKKGQGAGKSTKAKPEAVTAYEAAKQLHKAVRNVSTFAKRGDTESLDALKLAAKAIAEAIVEAAKAAPAKAAPAKAAPKAKRQAKAA